MPANRSRTHEWRRCLKQVWERGGSLEVAVAGPNGSANGPARGAENGTPNDSARGSAHSAANGASESAARRSGGPSPHLVWRVRLLNVSETEILIEQPSALGQAIDIRAGVELVVIMSIGQNRWMFTTRTLGASPVVHADRKLSPTLRLAMPKSVERCQRRHHYRVDTAALHLPQVEVWPLLDPKSVIVAERACAIRAAEVEKAASTASAPIHEDLTLPEVGPKFTATLVNLGGGGVGLRVTPQDSQALGRHKIFWMRLALPVSGGTATTPICATGKLVHTHMESNHDTYAGMAFDFSFNPSHQRFVFEQISRYIALQQQDQFEALESERDRAAA